MGVTLDVPQTHGSCGLDPFSSCNPLFSGSNGRDMVRPTSPVPARLGEPGRLGDGSRTSKRPALVGALRRCIYGQGHQLLILPFFFPWRSPGCGGKAPLPSKLEKDTALWEVLKLDEFTVSSRNCHPEESMSPSLRLQNRHGRPLAV